MNYLWLHCHKSNSRIFHNPWSRIANITVDPAQHFQNFGSQLLALSHPKTFICITHSSCQICFIKRYTYINYAKILRKKLQKKGHDKTKHKMSLLNEFFLHYLCFFFLLDTNWKKAAWKLPPEDEGYFLCKHVIRFKNDRKKLGK